MRYVRRKQGVFSIMQIHYAKSHGNSSRKSNGKVLFGLVGPDMCGKGACFNALESESFSLTSCLGL